MIPFVGFGTYRILNQEIFEIAIKCGYNAFDTAELYKNEQLVKNAIDKCSDGKKIHITTKISKKSIESENITESFYERLSIFGYIDIILLHHPTNNCKRDWDTLCSLYSKNRDKVGYIGVSNYDINHIEQIKDSLFKPYCDQIELSPFYTRKELVEYLNNHKIRIVSHTTLTRTEKFGSTILIEMSDIYKCSVANILLSWANIKNYTVVPKSIDINHITENISHRTILDKKDIDILDSLNENFFITKVII